MIDPVAIQLGPFPVRWYGVIMASAFILGTYLLYREARRQQIDPESMIDMVLWIIPAAIIGARAYYVVFEWQQYVDNPWEAFAVWHGGLAIHGGLIGGFLAGLWFVRRHGLNPFQVADMAAPSIILGQTIGRWGNFINQEAHGGPVSKEFMDFFPAFIRDQMNIGGTYYHPTFLYESLWDFGVFLFLMFYRDRKAFHGEVAFLYLGLYSVGRFFVEGLRTDSLMLGPLRMAQVISLALLVLSVSAIVYYRRKGKATA